MAEYYSFTDPSKRLDADAEPYELDSKGLYNDYVWGGREKSQQQDVDRYRGMGAQQRQAPVISSSAVQNRGMQMGALGLIKARAEGTQSSVAQGLLAQQNRNAMNAQTSLASSVRGGAATRAAAARAGVMNSAGIAGRGQLQDEALRAGEMQDARGALFGAATGIRGNDLDLETERAKLDAGQRQADQQRGQFYEDLGWRTKKSSTDAALGYSAAESAATNAANISQFNADRQAQQNFMRSASAVTGGATGLVSAIEKYDDDNATSDWRAKKDVKPVSDARAEELRSTAQGIIDSTRGKSRVSDAEAARLSGKAKDSIAAARAGMGADADGYKGGIYRALPDWPEQGHDSRPIGTAALHAAIERDVEGATPYEVERETPRGLFGVVPKGYARSRAGQAGAAFFGAPMEARHGFEPRSFGAPGTGDDASFRTELDPYSRQIALSDERAKEIARREGFDDGIKYETASAAGLKPEPPGYIPRAIVQGAKKLEVTRTAPGKETSQDWQQPGTPPPAPPTSAKPAPKAPPKKPAKGPKKAELDSDPMADANRSMVASSYEYKPEFTPGTQQPGEVNVGPMAQNMARDPVARTAIVEDPDTGLLAIDKEKALKLTMGSLASLQRQIDSMKGRSA